MKENRIILEKPLDFLIILANSTPKSEKDKGNNPGGRLFCRNPACKKALLYPDKDGLHKCKKCGRSRKIKGKRIIVASKAKPYRERKMEEKKE